MDEAKARVYAAVLLSPLSILIAMPIGGSIFNLIHGFPFEFLPWVQAGLFILGFAYPAMLLIGLPSYLILRRFKLDMLWTAVLIGYLTAAVVPLLLGLHGERPSSLWYWVNPLFFLGPVVGFVFWWVAKAPPEFSN